MLFKSLSAFLPSILHCRHHLSFRMLSTPTINKELFSSSIRLVSLRIPAKTCNEYMAAFKDYAYQRPKMRRICYIDGDANNRLFLLSEKIQNLSLDGLPENLKEFNQNHGGTPEEYELAMSYENFATDEVLKRLLPNLVEIPSSFEQAGHIAHLNLRDEALPHKHLIAQVILDKNPSIKTVVNKVGSIETEFRTFPMEVITMMYGSIVLQF